MYICIYRIEILYISMIIIMIILANQKPQVLPSSSPEPDL